MRSRKSPLSLDQFVRLLRDAAADTGAQSEEPGLYALMTQLLESDAIRATAIDVTLEYVAKKLSRSDRAQFVVFLDFLVRAELILKSQRVFESLVRYVDARIDLGGRETHELAALLLNRGGGQSAAHRWLPKLRRRMHQTPDWSVVDALAEIPGLVPEEHYSRADLFADIQLLRGQPEFGLGVEVRRAKWARHDLLVEELKRTPEAPYRVDGAIEPFLESLESANSGRGQVRH